MIFWLGRKNCVVKNEKWIVFPESWYVNSNHGIFNHPMIYQICDAMMSISTWDMVHFWIYLLSHNSLSHQTWPIDRYKNTQYFFEIL